MKNVMSVVAIALLMTGLALPAMAADEVETATVETATQAQPQQSASAMTADQWLEAREVDPATLFWGGNCNQATCGPGQFCCNYSCSTCANLGDYCTQQICPPVS